MNFATLEYLHHYVHILNYIISFIGIVAFIAVTSSKRLPTVPTFITFVIVVVGIYTLGAFPEVSGSYSDKYNYYLSAKDIAAGYETYGINDAGFNTLTWIIVQIFPLDFYFYVLSAIYVCGILYFCRSLSREYVGIFFIAMILNFQFVSYGSNTIRAGIGSSLVLIGIACRGKRLLSLAIFIIAMSVHKSMLLPIGCYLLSAYRDNTRAYFIIWLLSIPVSAVAGNSIQSFLATLIEEDRVQYLTTSAADTTYNVGFRIDFIMYSCVPIVLGYYYIYKRNFQEAFYKNLYNMYLLANTFWILVIRANFSDRFAYLSWFIYPIILLYPPIKDPSIIYNSRRWVAYIILGLTLFHMWF